MEKIVHKLNYWHYGVMLLALVVPALCSYCIMRNIPLPFTPLQPASQWGKVIQYLLIADALVSIPLGLYGFKRKCAAIRLIEDEQARFDAYGRWAAVRTVLVSNTMVFGPIAFYGLGSYPPMMWIAAMGAVGWIFAKPAARKMQIELSAPSDDNLPTY